MLIQSIGLLNEHFWRNAMTTKKKDTKRRSMDKNKMSTALVKKRKQKRD